MCLNFLNDFFPIFRSTMERREKIRKTTLSFDNGKFSLAAIVAGKKMWKTFPHCHPPFLSFLFPYFHPPFSFSIETVFTVVRTMLMTWKGRKARKLVKQFQNYHEAALQHSWVAQSIHQLSFSALKRWKLLKLVFDAVHCLSADSSWLVFVFRRRPHAHYWSDCVSLFHKQELNGSYWRKMRSGRSLTKLKDFALCTWRSIPTTSTDHVESRKRWDATVIRTQCIIRTPLFLWML